VRDKTLLAISELATWPENWNGYCVLAPNPVAIEHAYRWFMSISSLVPPLSSWIDPQVCADGDGNVFFGWRNVHRHLDVYVEPDTICFLTFEGRSDIDNGEISSLEDFQKLWAWLIT
jgi:hypothetical protein